MLVSLKDIVGCDDYYIDDETFQIVSFKNKKYTDGKILKPRINKYGYIDYSFYVNGTHKHILLHKIIVKLFIDKNFDSSKSEVDHKNRNKLDNSIDNLSVVSHSANQRNKSSHKGKEFNYIDNIGNYLVINKEAQIYYSLEFDKFFMFLDNTNKYKELHIHLDHGKYPFIQYCYNNKQHNLFIGKFKKSLNKKQ